MNEFVIIMIVLGVIAIIILGASVRIVKQSTAVVIERLGKFHKILETGIHMVVPFFDRANGPALDLRERVADFPPQPVITKDNVTMQIDTVVYFQITDPKLYCYGVARPVQAIENLTATTLRNIVGELELDQTLTSRDTVNAKMRAILDDATDAWGIKIHRVELKNILPPKEIREAMEKQMRAERERREQILRAEGEKQSRILVAEGEKAAAVLVSEAKKISLITEAEGKAQSIKSIVNAKPDNSYLTLQGFEALKELAKGESTKIIVPSNIQDVTAFVTSIAETVRPVKSVKTKK